MGWLPFLLCLLAYAVLGGALLLRWLRREVDRRVRDEVERVREATPGPPEPAGPPPGQIPEILGVRLESEKTALKTLAARLDDRSGGLDARLAALEATALRVERRVGDLTSRLERLEEQTSAPPAEEPVPPAVGVRDHLRRLGYERSVVFEGAEGEADTLRVEVERDGLTWKGHARVDVAGRVHLELRPATRVFP